MEILIRDISEHPELSPQEVDLILIAENLERVGDHATNIAEDVILAAEARNLKHADKLAQVAVNVQDETARLTQPEPPAAD